LLNDTFFYTCTKFLQTFNRGIFRDQISEFFLLNIFIYLFFTILFYNNNANNNNNDDNNNNDNDNDNNNNNNNEAAICNG